jgi:hypothetical protein
MNTPTLSQQIEIVCFLDGSDIKKGSLITIRVQVSITLMTYENCVVKSRYRLKNGQTRLRVEYLPPKSSNPGDLLDSILKPAL